MNTNQEFIEYCTCGICHQLLKIPVKLTCFNKCGVIHGCTERKRVCKKCGDLFFRVDRRQGLISDSVRCPFCNLDSTNIILGSSKNSYYEKDYIFMNFMFLLAKNGQIPFIECYCGKSFVDQFELEEHLEKECIEMMEKCDCGKEILRKEREKHNLECILNFNICGICGDQFGKEQKKELINHCKACVKNLKMVEKVEENSLKMIEEQRNIFEEAMEKLESQTGKILNNIKIYRQKIQCTEEQIKKFENL